MALEEIIIDKIKRQGPIAFEEFMDMCLYHSRYGYYTSERQKIGKDGDYYTSCCLTPSYGASIARQIEEMWEVSGKKAMFTIVEYGAGMGFLCLDILKELKQNEEMYSGLRYCIIEKSPFMRQKEKECLKEKVYWYESIDDIESEIDCVLSNEVLDNFPVHQVIMQKELMEVFVDYKDTFTEVLQPATEKLKAYFEELGITLPEGYRTEVNLQAINWLQSIADRMEKGFIITIDYGDLSENLYKNYRSCGSLVSYNNHRISTEIYCNPGGQDITAHVNFSALQHWGKKVGLATCGITHQAYFLLSLGFREHLEKSILQQGKTIMQAAREIALINHTMLLDMGHKFKVLIQSKGMPDARLRGLDLANRTCI